MINVTEVRERMFECLKHRNMWWLIISERYWEISNGEGCVPTRMAKFELWSPEYGIDTVEVNMSEAVKMKICWKSIGQRISTNAILPKSKVNFTEKGLEYVKRYAHPGDFEKLDPNGIFTVESVGRHINVRIHGVHKRTMDFVEDTTLWQMEPDEIVLVEQI